MATVEQAEQMEHTVMMNASRDSLSASVRIAGHAQGGAWHAMQALTNAVREFRESDRDTGKVTLKTFSKRDGDRDVLALEDKRVAEVLEKELKRYSVTFAVDQPEKGVREFHVHTRDAKIIEHALDRAQTRVYEADAKLTLKQRIEKQLDKMENPASRQARELHRDLDKLAPDLNEPEKRGKSKTR